VGAGGDAPAPGRRATARAARGDVGAPRWPW
jgi:hypothetical protein